MRANQSDKAAPDRAGWWEFLKAFVRARRTIGAVAPTSRYVARHIARLAQAESAHLMVELGPGTGAITRELLAALPPDGRLWAFEIYAPFVDHLHATIDDHRFTLVAESAEAIRVVQLREGLPGFDAIISAIPFSLLDSTQTSQILQAAADALRPGGIFIALQYHPRYLEPFLRRQFAEVQREWYPWNIPPAMSLRASSSDRINRTS